MAKILIADDDSALREIYQIVISQAGYEVITANDGGMALKLLVNQPDLILLDMMMPGMSGMDFLEAANIPEKYPEIKVIVLSNYDAADLQIRAGEAGVYKYLVKANTPHAQLLEEVRMALNSPPTQIDVTLQSR